MAVSGKARDVEDRVKLAIEARARLMTRQSSLAKRSDSFVRLSARLIPEDRRKEVPGTILLDLLQRGSQLLPRDGTQGGKRWSSWINSSTIVPPVLRYAGCNVIAAPRFFSSFSAGSTLPARVFGCLFLEDFPGNILFLLLLSFLSFLAANIPSQRCWILTSLAEIFDVSSRRDVSSLGTVGLRLVQSVHD